MPEHPRIAEILAAIRAAKHRIPGILGPCPTTIVAVGNPYGLAFALAAHGKHQDQYIVFSGLQPAAIVEIHHSRATPTVTLQAILRDRNGPTLPVDQILAHGMGPIDSPAANIRIPLILQVVQAIVVEHSAGIIHPTTRWRVVKLRPPQVSIFGNRQRWHVCRGHLSYAGRQHCSRHPGDDHETAAVQGYTRLDRRFVAAGDVHFGHRRFPWLQRFQ